MMGKKFDKKKLLNAFSKNYLFNSLSACPIGKKGSIFPPTALSATTLLTLGRILDIVSRRILSRVIS